MKTDFVTEGHSTTDRGTKISTCKVTCNRISLFDIDERSEFGCKNVPSDISEDRKIIFDVVCTIKFIQMYAYATSNKKLRNNLISVGCHYLIHGRTVKVSSPIQESVVDKTSIFRLDSIAAK